MATQDKFFYSFVAKGEVVLAEYSLTEESHKQNALDCLRELGLENRFYTLPKENKTYSFLIQDGFSYISVSSPIAPKDSVMYFLDRVRKDFEANFASNAANAQANAFDSDFGPKIKEAMDYVANNPQEFDKIEAIKAQEQELKGLLAENLKKITERGEKVSEISKKANALKSDALEFQTVTTAVKNKFWWENIKLQLLLALILLIIIIIIIIIIVVK